MRIYRRPSAFKKVIVCFERRSDGGLRAFSDDVPGFVLSGPDADAVLDDVQPALEVILAHILKGQVEVEPLMGLRDELLEAGVISDASPPPIGRQEYITRLVAA